MFGIDGAELLIVALVALVVLGPERLPKAARFAGLWVRRARAQWYSVKSELERELAAEELQRSLRDTRAAAQSIDAEVRAAGDEARREFDAIRHQLRDAGEPQVGATDDAPALPSGTMFADAEPDASRLSAEPAARSGDDDVRS
ncbi:MAG: Sec-independent protein translocase protein TatB [Pseudomonadota bacterium]